MDEVSDSLHALLRSLEDAIRKRRGQDAIDRILGGEPRHTRVRSLRDHEVVNRFRQELVDGLIRVDTANRLLGMIRDAMDAALS